MKNFNNLKIVLSAFFLIFALNSCTNNDATSSIPAVISVSKSVVDDPTIENDRKVDVLVDEVIAGNTYIIRGSGFASLKSIAFNGLESAFNSTLITDNVMVVRLDEATPYYNEKDEMTIVTNSGTLVYKINVRPPFPKITGFPINALPGDIITITGDYFLKPVISFGTTKVTPISATLTELKVKVPADNFHKYLSVANVSGTTVAGQAFGTAIYDDQYSSLVSFTYLWDATNPFDVAYDKNVYQSKKCIYWQPKGWQGFGIAVDPSKIVFSQFRGIRIAIKGEAAGSVRAILNGDFSKFVLLEFKSDWTYLEIPFEALGVTEFKELILQESGNKGGNTIYIDDVGLMLKR